MSGISSLSFALTGLIGLIAFGIHRSRLSNARSEAPKQIVIGPGTKAYHIYELGREKHAGFWSMRACPDLRPVCRVRTKLNEAVGGLDVRIFYSIDYAFNTARYNRVFMPERRLPSDLYALYFFEPPTYTATLKDTPKNFFNFTLGYSPNCDVRVPYGIVRDKKTEHPWVKGHSLEVPKWCRYRKLTIGEIPNFGKKTKLAVMITRNCASHSRREVLVENLQKYMPVDVFGRCGRPFNSELASCEFNNTDFDEFVQGHCFGLLQDRYYFYFAFENSVCPHYTTEKLFHASKYGLIPVVLKRSIAEEYLPSTSFMAVDDFESLQDMATSLTDIAFNKHRYLSYFNWKRCYRTTLTVFQNKKLMKSEEPQVASMCDVCLLALKMRNGQIRQDGQKYEDIEAWYRKENGHCIERYGEIVFGN